MALKGSRSAEMNMNLSTELKTFIAILGGEQPGLAGTPLPLLLSFLSLSPTSFLGVGFLTPNQPSGPSQRRQRHLALPPPHPRTRPSRTFHRPPLRPSNSRLHLVLPPRPPSSPARTRRPARLSMSPDPLCQPNKWTGGKGEVCELREAVGGGKGGVGTDGEYGGCSWEYDGLPGFV